MLCPRCGAPVPAKLQICSSCGADLTIYKKILYHSNKYYNKGLERAKVRDLSGAVIMLKKSLEMNRFNTNARNLLGLVFFEMGEAVAALSEWVISKNLQPDNNRADFYMDKLQANSAKMDQLNQAIRKYNIALDAAKQKNEDLAILQLKKVVNMNPNFLRARQLLALLYIHAGEKERAAKQLAKAIKIDVTNVVTLRYMQEVAKPQDNSGTDEEPDNMPENVRIAPTSNYTEDRPNVMAWITLVAGVLVGILVTFLLLVPNAKKSIRAEYEKQQLDYSSELRVKEASISALEKEKELWKSKYEETDKELSSIVIPEYDEEMYRDLFVLAAKYVAVNRDGAMTDEEALAMIEALTQINTDKWVDEKAQELYSKLNEELYTAVVPKLENAGRKAYSDKDYAGCAAKLQKAFDMGDREEVCIYYLADAYRILNDKEQAIVYFELFLETYPSATNAEKATTKLNKLRNE